MSGDSSRSPRSRRGPTTSAPVVGTYTKGTLASEVSRQGDWVEIVIVADDPLGGFMAKDFLAPASSAPSSERWAA